MRGLDGGNRRLKRCPTQSGMVDHVELIANGGVRRGTEGAVLVRPLLPCKGCRFRCRHFCWGQLNLHLFTRQHIDFKSCHNAFLFVENVNRAIIKGGSAGGGRKTAPVEYASQEDAPSRDVPCGLRSCRSTGNTRAYPEISRDISEDHMPTVKVSTTARIEQFKSCRASLVSHAIA